MTGDFFERVRATFLCARGLPAGERSAYLDAACGGDASLRRDVEELLAADPGDEEGAFLAGGFARGTGLPASGPAALPERIGQYRIVRLLGRGGMGEVYEAVQQRPNRTVALKVVRAALLSPAAMRRFSFEAEVLGRLQHPDIAAVYDAGTAEVPGGGVQPFFAMEYVDGQPLLAYADAAALTPRQRLELLARIADAIHYAHTKGVIHRDLKPANILVGREGRVKVLDFGLAKTTDADVQLTTLRTEVGALLGTLTYMAPEQTTGDPNAVDTRTDIYALGVLAYELLTGRVPHDVRAWAIVEAVRAIREDTPTPLSSVDRTLRGDIETIVGKALDKDKSRRYQAASDLAADVRRYLAHEPITARTPSAWYQFSRFARRNKAVVGGAAGVVAALLVGLLATGWQAIRASRAEDKSAGLAISESRERRTSELRLADVLERQAESALDSDRPRQAVTLLDEASGLRARHGEAGAGLAYRQFQARAALPEPVASFRRDPRFGQAPLENIRLSRDGSLALAPNPDGSATLYDVPLGVARLTLPPHAGGCTGVSIGAGGDLVTAGADGEIRRYDAAGTRRWSSQRVWPQGSTITLHAGGRQVLVKAPNASRVQLFDLTSLPGTGAAAATAPSIRMIAEFDAAQTVALSADGKRLLRWADGGRVEMVNATDGTVVGSPEERQRMMAPLSAFLAADGSRFASFIGDSAWAEVFADRGQRLAFLGASNTVRAVAFDHGGRFVAVGGDDPQVDLWSTPAYKRSAGLMLPSDSGAAALAFSGDDQSLVVADRTGAAHVWATSPPSERLRYAGMGRDHVPLDYASSQDGLFFASVYSAPDVMVWDTATGIPLARLVGKSHTRETAKHYNVSAVAVSPDGHLLAVLAPDGLEVWDLRSRTLPNSLANPTPDSPVVRGVTFSSDGTSLIAATAIDVVQVDLKTMTTKPLAHFERPELFGGDLDSTGRRVAVTRANGTAGLIDLASGKVIQEFGTAQPTWGRRPYAATPSPKGRYFATSTMEGAVLLWDAASGRLERRLERHTGSPYSLRFSPDDNYLISRANDNHAYLWETSTGRCLGDLRGSAAFLHGQRTLIAATPYNQQDGFVYDLDAFASRGRLRDGATSARERLAREPDDPVALQALGEYYASVGMPGWAVGYMERARHASDALPSLPLARVYWRLGNSVAALSEFVRALERREAPDGYLRLCMAAIERPAVARSTGPGQRRATPGSP